MKHRMPKQYVQPVLSAVNQTYFTCIFVCILSISISYLLLPSGVVNTRLWLGVLMRLDISRNDSNPNLPVVEEFSAVVGQL